MRTVQFENQITREIVECEDLRNVQVIDGVEYLSVRRQNNPRTFLIRKDSLKKLVNKK